MHERRELELSLQTTSRCSVNTKSRDPHTAKVYNYLFLWLQVLMTQT